MRHYVLPTSFFLSHRVSTWFAVEGMFASFRLSYFSFLVTLCVWKLYNRYEPKARLARHLCRLRDCFWCVCVCALSQLCNRGHKIWFKTIFKRIKLGIHRDLFLSISLDIPFFLNIPYVCSRVNLVELRRYFFLFVVMQSSLVFCHSHDNHVMSTLTSEMKAIFYMEIVFLRSFS